MTQDKADDILKMFIRINNARLRYLLPFLKEKGITHSMYQLIVFIKNNPGASQHQFAQIRDIDKAAVARDASRLDQIGYILRTYTPENKKRYSLNLTDKGIKICEQAAIIRKNFEELAFYGIDNENMQRLYSMMSTAMDNVINGCAIHKKEHKHNNNKSE